MNEPISREVNKEEIAWMAGVWDGEGSIRAFFGKNGINGKPTLCVEAFVKNTDVWMIKKVSDILYKIPVKFCFFLQKAHIDKSGVPHQKVICIKVSGKGNLRKLLTIMFPYLTTKKHQASLMLELVEYRESLGYHGPAYWRESKTSRSQGQWNGKVIMDDKKIVQFVNRIKKSKKQLIDPSETTRVAGKPLEIKPSAIQFA